MKITNEKVPKFNTFHFYCGSLDSYRFVVIYCDESLWKNWRPCRNFQPWICHIIPWTATKTSIWPFNGWPITVLHPPRYARKIEAFYFHWFLDRSFFLSFFFLSFLKRFDRHSIYGDNMDYSDSEGITQWRDLAKIVCDGVEDGPPSRTIPTPIKSKVIFPRLLDDAENTNSLLSGDLEDNEVSRIGFFFYRFFLSNNCFVTSRLKVSITLYFVVNVAYERHLSTKDIL